jgi:hypothetical protein
MNFESCVLPLVKTSDQRGTVGVGTGEHVEQLRGAGLPDGGDHATFGCSATRIEPTAG